MHQDKRCIVNQREIGIDTESYADALRHVVRQDPDVILIGEMRDYDTVSAALTAAEIGNLVFSTLHTIDATETVNRVIDFFPPHQQQQIRLMLGSTLKGIVSLRLIPSIQGGLVPAVEVLVMTGTVREYIIDPDKTYLIRDAMEEGYLLRDADVRPVAARACTRTARSRWTTPSRCRPQRARLQDQGAPARRRPGCDRAVRNLLVGRTVRPLLAPACQAREHQRAARAPAVAPIVSSSPVEHVRGAQQDEPLVELVRDPVERSNQNRERRPRTSCAPRDPAPKTAAPPARSTRPDGPGSSTRRAACSPAGPRQRRSPRPKTTTRSHGIARGESAHV